MLCGFGKLLASLIYIHDDLRWGRLLWYLWLWVARH